jgi:hypothetical protein
MAANKGGNKPLAHAKMLVLGQIGWITYDTPYGEQEKFSFEPQRVWWGSANWTEGSKSHLEVGFDCDDSRLVDDAAGFVADMILFSESTTTSCPGPEPDLVQVGYDNEAMAEAAAESEFDGYDYDDYDDE